MRLLFIIVASLTIITQYPLWWGKGGWLRVHELQQKVVAQRETNQALVARNDALAAEVQDLKAGTQAIEERARGELGMVKEDEIYVQLLPGNDEASGVATPKLSVRNKGN
jgi:cell division protein FtsB